MEKSRRELQAEISMLRGEIKVAREAAEITSDFVVRQFEQTERMLHRFQTADSERQAVLDGATQLSIIATDLDGTIQLFSKGASTLLGYNPREMIGKNNILSLHLADELDHYGKKVSGVLDSDLHDMRVFDQFVKQKKARAQEWIYVCRDDTHLPVSLSITSLYNPDGTVVGYLFTAMDMTLQKLMERELITSKESAEQANTSKGDFLARMSHEIRTPMNGIIGMASLLQKTSLGPKQHNFVDKIQSSANTLLRLINDILDFSKIDAGKLELEVVPFSLEDVLGNITNVIGMQAEQKGLEFLFHLQPQIKYNLIGDPLRLGQILMNLAGNAVKFTDKGEIVISVSQEVQDQEHLTLRFSVKDSGIGLEPDQVEKLFSAFSQADDSITRKYGGTGLGLAICQQLTDLMGGEIWVESTLGKGSEFIFTAQFQLSEELRPTKFSNHLEGLRALIVDDNEAARDVLSSMLTSLKIQVDTAIDGKSALNCLERAIKKKTPYDVVLLDWIMPGIDGIETARKIKANAALAKVPAMLMVTANGREEAYFEAEKAGINAFLLKPVYASVMYNTLLEILGFASTIGPRTTRESCKPIEVEKIAGSHILLVDDNGINLEVATAFLEDVGLIVTTAITGKECIEALAQNSFDLVLMDIQMPEMDGLEATKKIRATPVIKDIPIIAMTAHAMTGDREKSLAAGMNEHITKPIDSNQLYNMLCQWIAPKEAPLATLPENEPGELQVKELIDIPEMRGIDQQRALKILDNNRELLLKMLYDFQKSYTQLPTLISTLSKANKWKEIQDKAHAIKGVSSYIGASKLHTKAEDLENTLNNGHHNKVESQLVAFIKTLNDILNSLSALPSIDREKYESHTNTSTATLHLSEAEPALQMLIELLEKGELSAEDHFIEVQKLFSKSGFDSQLQSISDLIYDIEYEPAARKTDELLKTIQERFGD